METLAKRLHYSKRRTPPEMIVKRFRRRLVPELVHLLEVALVINISEFPAFRVAFEPAAVKWDVDPAPFIQRASTTSQGGAFVGMNMK